MCGSRQDLLNGQSPETLLLYGHTPCFTLTVEGGVELVRIHLVLQVHLNVHQGAQVPALSLTHLDRYLHRRVPLITLCFHGDGKAEVEALRVLLLAGSGRNTIAAHLDHLRSTQTETPVKVSGRSQQRMDKRSRAGSNLLYGPVQSIAVV
ncbi:hypothetical protein INR49_008782 [Caranx melampygus]|nr:hypothetical protein INR49_008782 [Caranx melampygus]